MHVGRCVMRTVVGVMGGGVASETVVEAAFELGRLIAEAGWVLLNGGRDAGVMRASAAGAHAAGGLVVGVLPDDDTHRASPDIDIAIQTGMGDARNVINVLSSKVVCVLPGGAGTLSEVALALKSGRPVVTLGFPLGDAFAKYYASGRLVDATAPADAVAAVQRFLTEDRS
ncbi:MAG: TIGR00725 family protein [Coriobacteriales bacterium]|nr:TIGR00725 family protein [Coriobacteriales bacterium]